MHSTIPSATHFTASANLSGGLLPSVNSRQEQGLDRLRNFLTSTSPKAILLDNDGVIVNSEPLMHEGLEDFFEKTFGGPQFRSIPILGRDYRSIYRDAFALGTLTTFEQYASRCEEFVAAVYSRAPITPGFEELVEHFISKGCKVAIVSSAKERFLKQIIQKISFGQKVEGLISLSDNNSLSPKPAPDGYVEAMKQLGVDPENCVALEDSRTGLLSAISALHCNDSKKGLVGCFAQNYVSGFPDPEQGERAVVADMRIESSGELLRLLKQT